MNRMDSNVLACLLFGLVAGEYRMPKITDGNRVHTEKAPPGSDAEAERIAAAEARRQRRLAKRSQSDRRDEHGT